MRQVTSIDQMNKNKYVFLMSLPIFVELMLQLLVGNIDQIMVGRVSQQSVAAIVNANQIMNLVIIITTMAAGATTVVLSQYLGAEDRENSSRTCMISMVLISASSIFTTIIVILSADSLLSFMNVPAEIFSETKVYLLVVAAFSVVQGLYLNYSSILRTFTLMKEVMYVSIIMNILNIVGNAILINGFFGLPQLGSLGAAISTAVSKVIGLILMILLYHYKVDLPMRLSHLKPFSFRILKSLCKLAIPSGAESMSYNLSQMCILGFVNSFGTMVTVTKGYCSILANLSYVYVIALAQAMQIVLGYLIGAKMLKEIQVRVQNTQKTAIIVCAGMATLLFLGSSWILQLFTNDPEVIALARIILGIEIVLEVGRAINIVMTRTLVAVGDIKTPTVVGISFHWAVAFVGSYLFGVRMGWGLPGVWIAMTIDECVRGLIYVIQFRREKWQSVYQNAAMEKIVD